MAARAIEPGRDAGSTPRRARAHRSDEDQAVPSPDVLRVADPATASSVIDRLQRTAGNRAVQRAVDGAHARRPAGPPVVVSRADDVTTTSISETTDTGNKYTQDLVLNKTKATIQVQLGINWVKSGTWASDADFKAFVQGAKNAAYQQGIPQAEFKARHFQHIVTEVAKAFAGYTCSLRPR